MSSIDNHLQPNYVLDKKPSRLQEPNVCIIPLKLMPASSGKENIPQSNLLQSPVQNDVHRIHAHFVAEAKGSNPIQTQPPKQSQEIIDNELGAKTLIALTAIAGGIGVGSMLGGFLIGRTSHKTNTNLSNPNQSNIDKSGLTGQDIFNTMPSILKSTGIGLASVIGAMGASAWLNKETPERLKMRIQNLKF